MDKLLSGVLNSDKPDGVKKTLIARIAAAGKDTAQPPEMVAAVLRTSLMFIVDGETEQVAVLSQPVFVEWASNNQHSFVEFFSESLVSDLLQKHYYHHPTRALWVIDYSLGLIRRNGSVSYTRLCKMVGQHTSGFLCCNTPDYDVVKCMCLMMLEHLECVPQDDSLHTFVTSLLRAVSRFSIPTDPTAVSQFVVEVPNIIGKLLHQIWMHDADVTVDTLRMVFDIVTEPTSTESMALLGAVIQFVPDVVMCSMLQSKACDTSLSDETALLALSRMLDMLCWPSTKNIDTWIITFMCGLASAHRYSVVMCIAGNKANQVCVH